MQANSGAIVKLDETGNLMITEGHFASEIIRVRRPRRSRPPQADREVSRRPLGCFLSLTYHLRSFIKTYEPWRFTCHRTGHDMGLSASSCLPFDEY